MRFTSATLLLICLVLMFGGERPAAAEDGPCTVTVCAAMVDTAQNKAAWECGWGKGYKAAMCDCGSTGRQCSTGLLGTKTDYSCTCRPNVVFDTKKLSEAVAKRYRSLTDFFARIEVEASPEELAKFLAEAADLIVLAVSPAAASVGPIKPLVTGNPADALPPGLSVEFDPSVKGIELRSGGKKLELRQLVAPNRKDGPM